MKKCLVIDTSSAILLYKSGWMEALLERYRVVTGPLAFREMTVKGYPGAGDFTRWQREGRIALQPPPQTALEPAVDAAPLDPGERECIHLYCAGCGAFILVDDGPAAAFCRRRAIPYVNALLVPRLLNPGSAGDTRDAMQTIFSIGRYAPWVLEYALGCPDDALSFFLP